MPLYFHIEKVHFPFNKRRLYKEWIKAFIEKLDFTLGVINVIFTSNDYLLSVNKEYLSHNYFTDVITFNYNEEKLISGDIFVSIEQVRINSKEFQTTFELELPRVVIHGVLHLLGWNDGTEEEKRMMRKKEQEALELLKYLDDGKSI